MKLLLAADLHYINNLAEEIARNQQRLPADTYDHQVDGKLYWHNLMMVEEGERLLDGLEHLARQQAPDRLLLLGDLVNVNWEAPVAAAAARVRKFAYPIRQVTGNHDIYLGDPACRLQDAVAPGTYASGVRHEIVEGLGLIYLDLFAKSASGEHRKWIDPRAAEHTEYRPQDIAAALDLMAAHPETPWLILGHFPFVSPDARIDQPGRKLGRRWPSAAPLAQYLQQPNNLLGMICGHQHFAHFQSFPHGFHWTLPAMVEYPCAAAILEWDGARLHGRIVEVDRELAATSLAPKQASWTAGEMADREFSWHWNRLLEQLKDAKDIQTIRQQESEEAQGKAELIPIDEEELRRWADGDLPG